MRTPHIVPLSRQALEVLASLRDARLRVYLRVFSSGLKRKVFIPQYLKGKFESLPRALEKSKGQTSQASYCSKAGNFRDRPQKSGGAAVLLVSVHGAIDSVSNADRVRHRYPKLAAVVFSCPAALCS